MNLDDTIEDIVSALGLDKSLYDQINKDQIKKVIVKALVTQSYYCLDAILKYKNQWDRTKSSYIVSSDNKEPIDRVVQLIVNMSTDDIKEMITNLEENLL